LQTFCSARCSCYAQLLYYKLCSGCSCTPADQPTDCCCTCITYLRLYCGLCSQLPGQLCCLAVYYSVDCLLRLLADAGEPVHASSWLLMGTASTCCPCGLGHWSPKLQLIGN
jgi:hypothetical protein